MKKINPLTLLISLSVIVALTIALKSKEERKKDELISQIKQDTTLAKKIVNYKKLWENKKFYEKNLQRLLESLSSRGLKYQKSSLNGYTVLRFERVGAMDARYILSSLLNQNFKIKELKIKRLADRHLQILIRIKR